MNYFSALFKFFRKKEENPLQMTVSDLDSRPYNRPRVDKIPEDPEVTVRLYTEKITNRKILAVVEPEWFMYDIGNYFVGKVYDELHIYEKSIGLNDPKDYDVFIEGLPSKEEFFIKYPEWKYLIYDSRARLVELVEADKLENAEVAN